MALHTQIITEKLQWENFLASRPEANFLQSWNWGEFHQRLGKKTFAVALFDDQGTQVGAAMVVKEVAKRGKYFTVAGGPLMNWAETDQVSAMTTALRELAQSEGCQFVRIRPQERETEELQRIAIEAGYKPSPMHVTADLTLQLDLNKTEDELLAEMRKNTRYEVRRAEKLGIQVIETEDPAEIQTFYAHQVELSKKHGFVPFSYEFLHEQFQVFAADHQVKLFHAKDAEGQLLASAFILFYHGEAVYHYGISTPANERMPGSYACQWAAIRWAKANSGQKYNFWGIAPEEQKEHRFAGVSLFKRGFGGQEVQYLPAHDLPVHFSYAVVRGFEFLRKKMRRL